LRDKKVGFIPWNNGLKGIFVGEENPNFGNKWSEEQKLIQGKKLQERYKDGFSEEHLMKLKEKRKGSKPSLGMTHSDEQKKLWSEKRKGDKYVNNGTITKRIKQFEIETFLQNGWVYGKLQKNNSETHKKLSERTKNRIWVSNSGNTKMVKPSELPFFLEDGWIKGRIV